MRSIFSWIFSADAASERSVAYGVGVANGSENDNVERALRPSMRIRSWQTTRRPTSPLVLSRPRIDEPVWSCIYTHVPISLKTWGWDNHRAVRLRVATREVTDRSIHSYYHLSVHTRIYIIAFQITHTIIKGLKGSLQINPITSGRLEHLNVNSCESCFAVARWSSIVSFPLGPLLLREWPIQGMCTPIEHICEPIWYVSNVARNTDIRHSHPDPV